MQPEELHGSGPFSRSLQLCTCSRTFQHIMEPEGSLLCSHKSSTSLSTEPHQCIHTTPSYLCKIDLNSLPSSLFPSGVPIFLLIRHIWCALLTYHFYRSVHFTWYHFLITGFIFLKWYSYFQLMQSSSPVQPCATWHHDSAMKHNSFKTFTFIKKQLVIDHTRNSFCCMSCISSNVWRTWLFPGQMVGECCWTLGKKTQLSHPLGNLCLGMLINTLVNKK
jgi:hypothetical protein